MEVLDAYMDVGWQVVEFIVNNLYSFVPLTQFPWSLHALAFFNGVQYLFEEVSHNLFFLGNKAQEKPLGISPHSKDGT